MFVHCSNECDTNREIPNELKACQTEITILKHKNSILTDLFDEHKAKYHQMVLLYSQREERLQLQLQHKRDKLQMCIAHQESLFNTERKKTNDAMREYSQFMQEYLQIIKSLQSQMSHQRRQMMHQQRDILLLTEQLKLVHDMSREKDETIHGLRASLDHLSIYTDVEPPMSRQFSSQTVKITVKRQKSLSVSSEYLSYYDDDISKAKPLSTINLSSYLLTNSFQEACMDLNETDHDNGPKYKTIVPSLSLSPLISDDSFCECDHEYTCV